MAMVITSFTPETGSVAGGTLVTVTGTGLTACTDVLVGSAPATLVGTPSATQVKFLTPPSAATGDKGVVLVDAATPAAVKATDPFTYAADDTQVRAEQVAKKMALYVTTNLAETDPANATKVMGIRTFKPAINPTTQDTGTYDSGIWGGNAKTKLGFQNDLTVLVGIAADKTLDPGQTILLNAHDKTGLAGRVKAFWFDRDGGPEAYSGICDVTWSPQGGDDAALYLVDVSLLGQGARTPISPNPVIANPALAA
jgi:hypothetical protein